MTAERAERAAERAEVEAMQKVQAAVNEILTNVVTVDSVLQTLANLSQEGRTLTMGDTTKGMAEFAQQLLLEDNNNTDTGLAGNDGLYTDLLASMEPFDVIQRLEIPFDEKHGKWLALEKSNNDTACYNKLCQVSQIWNAFISRAKILQEKQPPPPPKTKDNKNKKKKKKAKTTDTIVQEVSQIEYKTKVQEGLKVLDTMLANNSASTTTKLPCYFPGGVSHEKDGVQPVLARLMKGIAQCCYDESARPAPFSPAKKMVRQEVMLPSTKQRTYRQVDVVSSKEGQYHVAMLDRHLQLFAEEKNLCRKGKTIGSLAREVERQTIGTLAKSIYYYFNLFGIGVSSWATGLTVNTVSVKLYHLRLSMTENDDKTSPASIAKLSLHGSRPYPLVTESNFDRIVQTLPECRKIEIADLKKELYGDDFLGGLDEKGVPCGLRLFWHLFNARRESLFGPSPYVLPTNENRVGSGPPDVVLRWGRDSVMQISTTPSKTHLKKAIANDLLKNEDRPILGSGSYGVVLQWGKDSVMKISTSPSNTHLKNELAILQGLLSSTEPVPPSLPSYVCLNNLPMLLGGIELKTKGLLIKPLGVPLLVHMSNNQTATDRSEIGTIVGKDISEALVFLHGREIYHNDVSPKNIVLIGNYRDDAVHAVLVDFSVASSKGVSLFGVRGTPAFLHPDVLQKHVQKQWQPVPKHDLTSLWFTLAAIHNGGSPNWSMDFPRCLDPPSFDSFNDTIKKRSACAEELLSETDWTWSRYVEAHRGVGA